MNIELRTKVLKKSLELEQRINKSISILIDIKAQDAKAITFKSSSIPLSSKVNLLYDLEFISSEEYEILFCFLEIRNKLMHDINTDTIVKAVMPNHKKLFENQDKSLKCYLTNSISENRKEEIYILLLDKLSSNVLSICVKLYERCLAKINNGGCFKTTDEYNLILQKSINDCKRLYHICSETVTLIFKKYTNKELDGFQIEEATSEFLVKSILLQMHENIKEEFPEIVEINF